MNLKRWLSVILVMGLSLALSSLSAQADPDWPYHRPHGHAYGWDGYHGKHFRHSCRGPHNVRVVERVYGGPPAVAYVTPMAPVAPVMGMPYAAPQPYSQPYQSGPPGFHGQFNYNF